MKDKLYKDLVRSCMIAARKCKQYNDANGVKLAVGGARVTNRELVRLKILEAQRRAFGK